MTGLKITTVQNLISTLILITINMADENFQTSTYNPNLFSELQTNAINHWQDIDGFSKISTPVSSISINTTLVQIIIIPYLWQWPILPSPEPSEESILHTTTFKTL